MKFTTILALLPLAIAAPTPAAAPRNAAAIPGQYIVKLRTSNKNDQTVLGAALKVVGKTVLYTYDSAAFVGFAAQLSDALVMTLKALPIVEYVEQDQVMGTNLAVENLDKRAYTTQTSSTWGLGRISQARTAVSNYVYDSTAGAGVCVYVIDSGIETTHAEFEGRATFLANYAGDGQDTDGNGHGTHVAGTIGSKTYGVAKKATLFAVKVLKANGQGTSSGVLAGVNFVTNDIKTRGCTSYVANLSLGGGQSASLNSAAANAVSAGVFMAVAAGNSAVDAGATSPASEPTVFTVGATNSTDGFASFSNFGSAVDILAPGVNVLSTWINGATAYNSGTSMATPHIAGLAAYLLAFEGKRTPAALATRIQSLAAKNKITSVPANTVNYLAFNGNPSTAK